MSYVFETRRRFILTPSKLTTTIKNIMSIPNSSNAELVREFYEFMESNGSSEQHQNNSLKATS
jgi:flagellar motor switch protein FliG